MLRDWRPAGTIEALRQRAALTQRVRLFFAERGVLEVETPLVSYATATDPHVHSLALYVTGRPCYLQTSPEFAMKRLLAAGSGPIYQICKAFRDDDTGPWHAVEFTMLEWYRPGFDHLQLLDETRALLNVLLPAKTVNVHQYRDLFRDTVGLDPWSAATRDLTQACVRTAGLGEAVAAELSTSDALDLLFSLHVQPALVDGIHFVRDYPVCQAALARLSVDGTHAERFEVFIDGIEIANAYHELSNVDEQRERMRADAAERQRRGQAPVPIDELLLQSLDAGIGDVAGIALGLDRLLALTMRTGSIAPVMAFDDETRGAFTSFGPRHDGSR